MSSSIVNETSIDNDSSNQNKNKIFAKSFGIIRTVFRWEVVKPILCGQGLSILICGTAISSEYLQNAQISVPLFQSFINYVLLGLVYTTLLFTKRTENGEFLILKILKKYGWKYALIALVDVEANFLVVKAYQFTSLTSVQLLDCFILPVVMTISYFLMKIRYVLVHYIGVVVALIGVGCMVGADVMVGKAGTGKPGSNPGLGDALVLGSAVLYGISNVSMEYISKKHQGGNIEILAMFGLFGPIICGTQMAILERQSLANIYWNIEIIGLFALFGVCMFLLYSLMPIVMCLSSATTVNISLLTADLYALFTGLFLFNNKLSNMYPSFCGSIGLLTLHHKHYDVASIRHLMLHGSSREHMSALYIVSFVTIFVALLTYNSRQPLSREANISDESDEPTLSQIEEKEDTPLTQQRGTSFLKSAEV